MSQSKSNNFSYSNHTDLSKEIDPDVSISKLLAISKPSGIPLFERKFDDRIKYQGQLLTIGLNALRIFMLDSFKRTNIANITVDDLTIRMANIDDIIIYYVHTGNPEEQSSRFNSFIQRLVTMECWERFSQSEYNTFVHDTKSISLMVEEIFTS